MFTYTENKNTPGCMGPVGFLVCASVSGDKPEGRNTVLELFRSTDRILAT